LANRVVEGEKLPALLDIGDYVFIGSGIIMLWWVFIYAVFKKAGSRF
jgi:hypothetical protein